MNRKQTQPFPRELQRAEEYFKTHIENADRPNFDFTIGGEDLPVGADVTELESNEEKRTMKNAGPPAPSRAGRWRRSTASCPQSSGRSM